MRTVIEHAENGDPMLIHIVTRTSTKAAKGWIVVGTACEIVLSREGTLRLSRRKPTCVACIAYVPQSVVIELPSFDIRQR